MKAIFGRLSRLENAAAPAARERAAAATILENMRRLGYDDPPTFPPESLEGCHTCADRINRYYKLMLEHEERLSKAAKVNV